MFGALIGGAVSALAGGGAGGALGGLGAAAFEAALGKATEALGGGNDSSAQIEQMMTEGATSVMGGMMMRLASEVLNSGMEDE